MVERELPLPVPQAVVPDTRLGIALAAAELSGRPSEALDGGGRHRHQRQDDLRLPDARRAGGRGPALRAHRHGGGPSVGGAGRAGHAHDPRPAWSCRPCWPGCATRATPPARWRSPRTRSPSAGPRACGSRRPCSPTSPATTWTTTAPSRTTTRPSGPCSCARRRRARTRPGAANLDDEMGRRLAAEAGALGYAVDAPAEVRPERVRGLSTGIAAARRHPPGPGGGGERPARALQPGEPDRGGRRGRAAGAAARGGRRRPRAR